jgi:cytochrome c1
MIRVIKLTLVYSLLLSQSVFAVQAIDSRSGLFIDEGYKVVETTCSTCHSLKLIVKSTASRQAWLDTIRWMQTEQGMQTLSKKNEKVILDYLAKNYAANNKRGRRKPLLIQNWTE